MKVVYLIHKTGSAIPNMALSATLYLQVTSPSQILLAKIA